MNTHSEMWGCHLLHFKLKKVTMMGGGPTLDDDDNDARRVGLEGGVRGTVPSGWGTGVQQNMNGRYVYEQSYLLVLFAAMNI